MSKKLFILTSLVLVLGPTLTNVAKGVDPSLVGWWKLDETSGTIAYDSSGNGNHGTLNGDPEWVAGQLSGALDFDGNGDFVEIPHSFSLSITDEITITAWTKMRGNASGEMAIVSKGGWAANDLPYELTETPGGVIFWQFYDDGGRDTCAPGSPPVDEWHHIVGTYDGNIFKCYIDGELANEWEYVGTMPENTASVMIGRRSRGGCLFNGIIDEVAIYDRALSEDEIPQVMMGISLGVAFDPSPDDGQKDVPRDVVLSWTPGEYAPPINGHKVYLSENFSDVNDGIGGVAQDANSYTPPQRVDFGTTYYWRVDEVNGPPDYTVYEGDVWSFTTELFAYPIDGNNITATASSAHQADMGPENTINGSGMDDNDLHSKEETDMWLSSAEPLESWIQYQFDRAYKLHQMWVWNSNQMIEALLGFGLKDVTIEYSANGIDYTTLGTTHEFARAPGADGYACNTTIDFGGLPVKYVRLTANSNWGGIMPQYGLSEIRFLHIPVHARAPYPASGAAGVAPDVVLGWKAGREVVTHDVYLSTDEQAVIDGTAPVATVAETSYGPLSLDLSTTYYWMVNEVNDAETPTTWESNLWSFTVSDFIAVDDFETYNDLDPGDPESNRIFNAWLDGYDVPTNGSLVGYEQPPFAEQTIVHSGKQSMPLAYSNTGGAAYSEAERTFAAAQNWTQAGAATFVLYFHGAEGNTGQLYVKVNGTKVVYDGDAADISQPQWIQWNIDLASLGVNLQNITKLSIGIDGNGASGKLYVDDIQLYRSAPEPQAN